MRNGYIKSIGTYVPERVITNEYFNELLGENVSDWLKEHVKIYERRWCSENESASTLAMEAGKIALEKANLNPEEIDLLIVTTDTPEYISPSTASKLQFKMGLKNAGTFDLNTACAGFVTAIDTAVKYIQADERYNNILVIGVYAMSKYLNKLDKKTVNLFADGAGAAVISSTKDETKGFLASKLETKGEYYNSMGIYAGGTAEPISEISLKDNDHLLQIREKFPADLNPKTWASIAEYLSKQSGVDLNDVKMFFFTQININSIFETMELLKLPKELAQTSMHYYGYTGSACIPLAINDALKQGKISEGDIIFMIGSGGGLAFAGAAFRL